MLSSTSLLNYPTKFGFGSKSSCLMAGLRSNDQMGTDASLAIPEALHLKLPCKLVRAMTVRAVIVFRAP